MGHPPIYKTRTKHFFLLWQCLQCPGGRGCQRPKPSSTEPETDHVPETSEHCIPKNRTWGQVPATFTNDWRSLRPRPSGTVRLLNRTPGKRRSPPRAHLSPRPPRVSLRGPTRGWDRVPTGHFSFLNTRPAGGFRGLQSQRTAQRDSMEACSGVWYTGEFPSVA